MAAVAHAVTDEAAKALTMTAELQKENSQARSLLADAVGKLRAVCFAGQPSVFGMRTRVDARRIHTRI